MDDFDLTGPAARPGREAAAPLIGGSRLGVGWAVFYRWGPYALLAIGTLAAGATAGALHMTRSELVAAAALTVAGAVLQLWWGHAVRTRPDPSTAGTWYYLLRWAIAFALTWLNTFYAFYAVTGYFGAERLLPRRWVRMGLLASAVTVSGSQAGGLPPHGPMGWLVFGALFGVNVSLLTVFTHFANLEGSARHSRPRPSANWSAPTSVSSRRSTRTPPCTPNSWSRHGRPGSPTSAAGWPPRSTTPSRRGSRASSPSSRSSPSPRPRTPPVNTSPAPRSWPATAWARPGAPCRTSARSPWTGPRSPKR